jgi:hypothetical protein
MGNQAELDRLSRQMTELWRRLSEARDRGDWQTYWKLRRSWLSLGRLHSFLVEQNRELERAQLCLVPAEFGRAHDRDPDAA